MKVISRSVFFVFAALLPMLLCSPSIPHAWAGSLIITDFRWLGIGEDRVGSHQTTPDGTGDARFQVGLEIAGSTEIREIRVFCCNQGGEKGGEYWYSQGAGGAWLLGVFNDGRMLNSQSGGTLGTISGKVQLDLFGNDSGRLGGFSHFLVEVENPGGTLTQMAAFNQPSTPKNTTVSTPSLTAKTHPLPPSQPVSTNPIVDFSFQGISGDRVSTTDGNPDGVADAVFLLQLNFSGQAQVSEIRVFASDASGSKAGEYWFSKASEAWLLGVARNGRLMNPKATGNLGSFSGVERLELFGNDSGRFGGFSHFLVEVIVNGETFSRLARAR